MEALVALLKFQNLEDMNMCVRIVGAGAATFFCNRTTLVHFFSRMPSYFFLVASSKLGAILASSRNASAVLGALMIPK